MTAVVAVQDVAFRRVAGDQLLIDRNYRRLGSRHFDGSLTINLTLER